MSINLTRNYVLGCKDNYGGVKRIYIIERSSITGYEVVNDIITSINLSNSPRTYDVPKNTASFTQSLEMQESGAELYKHTVSMSLPKLSTEFRGELQRMVRTKLTVLVVDNAGKVWVSGLRNGLRLVSNEASTGRSRNDLSGYSITLEGYETDMAYETSLEYGVLAGNCDLADSDGVSFMDNDGIILMDFCPDSIGGDFSSLDFSNSFFINT